MKPSVRVFDGGHTVLPHILQSIGESQKTVEIRAFLWRDDETGNSVAEALLDAADRGVKVNIQKDRIAAVYEYVGGNQQSFFHKRINPSQGFQAWFLKTVYRAPGSFKQRPNSLAQAMLSHPNITISHKRRRFDHSKVFVFDEQKIILGSMGIGDNHVNEWHDLMVEISGAESVLRFRERLGGQAEFDPSRSVDFLVHTRDVQRQKQCSLLNQRLELIASARSSLHVEMAYMGDRRFTRALVGAIKRGVRVTLLTAERADVLGSLNRSTCDALIRAAKDPEQLEIFFLPQMVHSKLMVIDRRWVDVGSANFTPLSHGVYDEINAYLDHPETAERFIRVMEDHSELGFRVSNRVGYRKFQSGVERMIVAYQSRGRARKRRPRIRRGRLR